MTDEIKWKAGELTEAERHRLAQKLVMKWPHFGRALDVSQDAIDAIDCDYRRCLNRSMALLALLGNLTYSRVGKGLMDFRVLDRQTAEEICADPDELEKEIEKERLEKEQREREREERERRERE